MFTSGIGLIRDEHLEKEEPDRNLLICKIGGPVYNIGLGGSTASSRISEESSKQLDYQAVQRADPQMEQKMNKVIRSCIELGEKNPIASIHDQGAGGNGNVLKELIDGKGAVLDLTKLEYGDNTVTDIETWLSEYQESNALLVDKNNISILQNICDKEDVTLSILGSITNDNKLKKLKDHMK